jgi:hypothetical protein
LIAKGSTNESPWKEWRRRGSNYCQEAWRTYLTHWALLDWHTEQTRLKTPCGAYGSLSGRGGALHCWRQPVAYSHLQKRKKCLLCKCLLSPL